MNQKEFILLAFKRAFITITPWKKRDYLDNDSEYVKGWNNCIKEIKKNRVRYIKFMEEKL